MPTNNSMPDSEDEANEADFLGDVEIGTLEESLISFRLSGLNEGLGRTSQSDDESVSS